MRHRITGAVVGIIAVALFAVAAAGASTAGGSESPRTKLTLVAPAAPGGGWDGFAREAQRIMRTNTIAGSIQVVNIPGASGTIGLGALAEMGDRHDIMMVTGGVMVGGILINNSRVDLTDVTPIARLADDFNVLVVPADSPFETLDDALAVSAAEPVDGIDVPTFVEQGVEVAMSNWRGYVAPPGIDPEVEAEMIAMVTEMRETPDWQEALTRNSWVDSFMVGDEFAEFIRTETERTEEIVKELGL